MKKPIIKPSHRGRLHRALGVPEGKPIPMALKEKAAHSSSPALAKEGQFAVNFSKGAPAKPKKKRKMSLRSYLNSPTF
jgi:hypothetical protein